jgi:glucokinase
MQNLKSLYLGIDIGGTTTKFGLLNNNNEIIEQKKINSNADIPPIEMLNEIKEQLDEILKLYPDTCSVGIGVPGVVTSNGILIAAENLPTWENVEVLKYFQSNYSNNSIVFATDNDANAAAVAELEAGVGKNLNNFFYITLGTGVGGTIIINRKIYKGINGGAGEIGHFLLCNYADDFATSEEFCILESIIGRKGIIKTANSMMSKAEQKNKFASGFDVSDISNAALNGNPLAIDIIKSTGRRLGITIASIAVLLDITNFIIGGGISQSDLLIDTAITTAKLAVWLPYKDRIIIEKANFLNNTGIIGAALLGKNVYSNITIS